MRAKPLVLGYCACCDGPLYPATVCRHHWIESPGGVVYCCLVCRSCNSTLKRPRKDPERIILPPFVVQRWYAGEVRAGRLPIDLATLVEHPDSLSYQEYVDIRLPGTLRTKIKDIVVFDGNITYGQWIVRTLRAAVIEQ